MRKLMISMRLRYCVVDMETWQEYHDHHANYCYELHIPIRDLKGLKEAKNCLRDEFKIVEDLLETVQRICKEEERK